MIAGTLIPLMAGLALVIGILLVCVHLLRRLQPHRVFGAHDTPLRIVARLGLAPRQGIVIVRVGRRGLMLGVGEGGTRNLAELTADEIDALEDEPAEAPGGEPFRTRLTQALRRQRTAAAALAVVLMLAGFTAPAAAQASASAAPMPVDSIASALLPSLSLALGNGADEGLQLRGTVGTVALLGLMVTLPTLLLLMTSFTRIIVVLHLLRQALGTQSTPPAHLLAALALLLSGLVMAPTIADINDSALRPWVDGVIDEGTMMRTAAGPLRQFMLRNTGERELATFLDLSETPDDVTDADVPTFVLMSAFATSELRAAFQMGFAIFLPFIVIDLVVAAVLTSMGMFMLPPTMIALPCKLMLFVLVDGWGLVIRGLVESFA